jgi:hypothetical protein
MMIMAGPYPSTAAAENPIAGDELLLILCQTCLIVHCLPAAAAAEMTQMRQVWCPAAGCQISPELESDPALHCAQRLIKHRIE